MHVIGKNVNVNKDSTGAFVSVDWECPHCHSDNYSYKFTEKVGELDDSFEIEIECDNCGENVMVVCDQ